MKEKPMADQDGKKPSITTDSELPRKDTDPAGEKSESDKRMNVSTMEHSTVPSGDLIPFVCTNFDSLQQLKTMCLHLVISFCFCFCLSSHSSNIKVHMLVAGETFNVHKTFMKKLNLQMELCSAESSSVILVFCPVVSRIGTDMEAAMARDTDNKPVILVLMHHCHHPSHMTNITVQPCRSNIVQVVHCAFHVSKGLLRCRENEQAVAKVQAMLKKYK
ncbi:uncharacterized protein LOC125714602 [Brienomyrus brachyistius]|uniref:uncharacterized protein LOC125714602 n=1 Tax=Brienomyrus brachyistius TaxID=42636 RepID=UPI0020B43E32|nr:uncharacterized protein LOC125714602 [Brienomyrus brachyistius]